jgi:hypothetical protein
MATIKDVLITIKNKASDVEITPVQASVTNEALTAGIDTDGSVNAEQAYQSISAQGQFAPLQATIDTDNGVTLPDNSLKVNINKSEPYPHPGTPGLWKKFKETVYLTEIFTPDHYTGIPKENADSISFSEIINWSIGKVISETVSITDIREVSFSKQLADSASLSEVLLKDYGKNITETISFSEVRTVSVDKQVQESITFTEITILALSMPRTLTTDVVTITEVLLRELGRETTETITLSEVVAKDLSIVWTEIVSVVDTFQSSMSGLLTTNPLDPISISEVQTFGVDKVPSETISFVEVFLRELGRNLTNETITISEVLAKDLSVEWTDIVTVIDTNFAHSMAGAISSYPTDAASLIEIFSWAQDKVLPETISLVDTITFAWARAYAPTEGISLSEVLAIVVDKLLSETITLNEIKIVDMDKASSDTITLSESGLINKQDYVTASYFAEDYVGTNYTF